MVYRKSILIFLLFIYCSVSQGQEIIYENVFFYLTVSNKKAKKNSQNYPLTLLIDNQSKDSIYIENFNEYIFHKLDYTRNTKTFFWDFLTTYNQTPDDIVVISGTPPNNQILGKNVEIAIPPNSIFVSDIYIRFPSFLKYGKGYYKLCLYYEKSDKHIAEIIIKID